MTWFKKVIPNTEKVHLAELSPFAVGDHRLCFRHPNDPSRCIKVNREGKDLMLWKRAPFYKKLRSVKSFNDNWQEYLSFQQPAITRNQPKVWAHIPRCYGWVKTDLGEGLITDYYGAPEGKPAPTLETFLREQGINDGIRQALREFIAFFRETLLITKAILPHNVVVVESPQGLRLVLIDGFGALGRLPVYKSRYFAKKYVEKRIKRFFVRLNWELSDKSITWEEAQSRKMGNEKDFI